MELQSSAGVSHALQTAAIAALIFAVCALFPKLNYRLQLARLPAFGGSTGGGKHRQTYLHSAKKMYSEGYEKFKDSVYRMATSDGEDNVVVPLNLLPELRKLPDDVLSFPQAIDSVMEAKYTRIDTDAKLVLHSVKSDLTPALNRLNPIICTEVDASLREYMPPCKDWTEIYIYKILVDVVAKVSGRVFVGPQLCQDLEYLDFATNYTMYVVDSVQAIKKTRPWLRPFLAPRLPELRQLREVERRAATFLEPIIRERKEAQKNDPNWQQPDDMLQWMMNRSSDYGITSVAELAKCQLGLIFAAIHTTTMTATNIIYTLAVTPEYINPIRDEIRNAMADNGGIITSRALQQMEKLDSYMKEVMRLYPPNVTSFERRVLKGITLSNGQYIPPGVVVEVPAHAIYNDSKYYSDGDAFDGFRHYKLRRGGSATDHARNQFVTTNEVNLAFGYGKHACPGRFFAANEIKMVFARLILEYDVMMPERRTDRYPQIEIARQIMPNPEKSLMFKKVEI